MPYDYLLIFNTIQKRYRINNFIKAPSIRVIGEGGKNLGVMETGAALKLAFEQGLDLIEISPTANPPVTKIMDFGKFKYEEERAQRQHKTKQKEVETKGIRIGYTTGKHDLELRARQAEKFLKEGNKVKIDMVLHGREKALRDFARKKFDEFLTMITSGEFELTPKKTPQGFLAVMHTATIKKPHKQPEPQKLPEPPKT